MKLLIETDLGHDPDDFFAICYLAAAGVSIECVVITPGSPDQVAVANLIRDELGLDFPIGVKDVDREKMSSGGVHHALLKKYGRSLKGEHDGYGCDMLEGVYIGREDEVELFIIGPPSNVRRWLEEREEEDDIKLKRATMQGGFVPYCIHSEPCRRLEKFEGKLTVPSFNPNGDRKGMVRFAAANVEDRRFVCKNVCHTVVYNKDIHDTVKSKCRASELFCEGMDLYLERHKEKKFHDPCAAACHLHPEIATWVRGVPVKMEHGWSTMLQEDGDYLIADLNYKEFWRKIRSFE